jgi:FkbM family methyltransferase
MKIIQIGTCVANDDLTQIVKKQQPELLVLIEPMSIHNEKINNCYSVINNVFLENIASTVDDTKEMSFYYHKNDGPMYEVATTDVNHILKHGYDSSGVVELKVKCMKINDVFEKYKLKEIDILFIDAEGLDDEIIKTIDFNKYKISRIYFENLHLKDVNIYEYLSNFGYTIKRKVGFMGWSDLAEIN